MLAFLLLVGLCVWNAFVVWSNLPAPRPGAGAYQAGVRIGIWAAPIIMPLIFLGIAWGIGWLVSLMFGKSDDAGNIGAGLVMLGALSLYGYGMYATLTAPPPAASGGSAAAATPMTQEDTARALADSNRKQMDELAEQSRRQMEAAQEASRRQLEALHNPQAVPPPPPVPTTAVPSSSPPPAPAPAQPQDPAIKAGIDAFEEDLNAKIDVLLGDVDKYFVELTHAPAHDLTRINARSDSGDKLRADADALGKLFSTATDDLTTQLVTAGVHQNDAYNAAFHWSGFDFRTASRGFAIDSIKRLCDKSKEECDFLRDNFSRWTLDSKGALKAKEFDVSSKARSLRFFVKADADRKAELVNQLKGR